MVKLLARYKIIFIKKTCSDLNEWPALAMFRNGLMVSFTEDVQAATEKQLNDWLTAESTLKIIGIIDEVKTVSNYKR